MEGRRERRRWGAERDRAGMSDSFIVMSKLKLSWTVLQLTDVQICAVLCCAELSCVVRQGGRPDLFCGTRTDSKHLAVIRYGTGVLRSLLTSLHFTYFSSLHYNSLHCFSSVCPVLFCPVVYYSVQCSAVLYSVPCDTCPALPCSACCCSITSLHH